MPTSMSSSSRSMGRGGGYPRWVEDPEDPMEKKIIRWGYLTILRQRGIIFRELAEYLEVSIQRVDQMMVRMSENDQMRIDEAITVISEEKHYASGCKCKAKDPSCVALSLAMHKYPEAAISARIALTKEEIHG